MGKKSGPPAPDYNAAAQQQAASSREVTNIQNWANRPTINTPWGTQSWETSQQIDPATGQPVTAWTMNTQLSPEQQASLDAQQRIEMGRSQGAETLLGQAVSNFQQPMQGPSTGLYGFGRQDVGGNAGLARQFGTPEEFANQAMEATWAAQAPQLAQRREGREAQLANMGLSRGSEAWKREMNRIAGEENAARLQAFQTGAGIQNQMFGQGLQGAQFFNNAQQQAFQNQMGANAQNFGQNLQYGDYQARMRQQQIAEEQARRGSTLNELNALLTGQQVGMPQMPSFNQAQRSEGLQSLNAAQMGYQANLDRYNAQSGAAGGLMSGIGSIAGAMGTGGMSSLFALSDARLKNIIARVGTTAKGFPVYAFDMFGNVDVGVLAQDVVKVLPDAVKEHESGYLMVNYAEVV